MIRLGIMLLTSGLLSACGVGDSLSQTGQSLYAQFTDQFTATRQYTDDPLGFDGSYQGRTQLISTAGLCPTPRYGVVMIGDNTLTYAYTPNQVFSVPVQPDGQLHGVAGDVTLDGQIARNGLVMTIGNATCTSRYAAHFILNHS